MTNRVSLALATLATVVLAFAPGCSQDQINRGNPQALPATQLPPADTAKYRLTAEPAQAADVIAVRKQASDGDDVVILGRIGGSPDPWTKGRAAFSIVDRSLKACSDIPGDSCEKPWDYCCETSRLPTATALIKLVDENGDLVKADAQGLLKVKELSTVVVQGKAKRDEAGNLTVLASGVFVKRE